MDTHQSRQINEYIVDYLKYHGLTNTIECLEHEMQTKNVKQRIKNTQHPQQKSQSKPKLYGILKGEKVSSKKEAYMDKDLKEQKKKYNMILQAARQIFSVAINCLQLLHSMKDVPPFP